MKNQKTTSSVEKLKKVSVSSHEQATPKKNGGARPGAGMPKGKMTTKVLERMKIKAAYNQRVMLHTDELFNAQLANAKGNTYIYKIVEIDIGGGRIKKKHELVTNPDLIAKVLDENLGNSGQIDNSYFIVTTEKPDNIAIKDMLDRTFGSATQKQEITGEDGGAIQTNSVVSVFDQETLKSLSAEQLAILKEASQIHSQLTNSKK